MDDGSWNKGQVVATILWALVVVFIGAAWAVFEGTVADRLSGTGLALSAAAATATIRGYHCRGMRLLRTVLSHDAQDENVRTLG